MKIPTLFYSSIIGTLTFVTVPCSATDILAYTNAISVRNISEIQHEITLNFTKSKRHFTSTTPLNIYGQELVYGEFNDDGHAITFGRNGGDYDYLNSNASNTHIDWLHFNKYTHFHNFGNINSRRNIINIGIQGTPTSWSYGTANWGIYAGYAGDQQTKHQKLLKINEFAGYAGAYSNYQIKDFTLLVTANAGAMINDATSTTSAKIKDFTNFWFGALTNLSYDLAIDNSLTLHPELSVGYTLVKSADFTLLSEKVSNSNYSNTSFIPGFYIAKNIADGWFGSIGAKYFINLDNGGTVCVNHKNLHSLKYDDYTEYGIKLEKRIENLNFSAQINRYDGGQTGWSSGFGIHYIF